ncbi:MAG: hypothetical protein IKM28_02315, partial [Lachnospiraceae bacterium]|nr:hypothetical protein [Lachnospiraceae bacterium]
MKQRFWKVAAAALFLTGLCGADVRAADNGYWKTTNPPVIYGATAVTLPEGTEFSTDDIRFRVFAK